MPVNGDRSAVFLPQPVGVFVIVVQFRCLIHGYVSDFSVVVLWGVFAPFWVASDPRQRCPARVQFPDCFPYVPVWFSPLFLVAFILMFEEPRHRAFVVHGGLCLSRPLCSLQVLLGSQVPQCLHPCRS